MAEGSTATVTFSGQADPSADDLANLTYSYDFDNDGTFEVIGSRRTRRPCRRGSWPTARRRVTVRARVADDDGGSLELTTDITITNAAATVTINGPSTATVGVPVTLKVGAVDPSPADMAGTFATPSTGATARPAVTLTGPADPPVTHTYTAAGTFTISATATDPDGATSQPLTFTITVAQAPPTTTTPDHDRTDDDVTDDDHRARSDNELDHDHTGQHDHLDSDRSGRRQPAAHRQWYRRCTPRRHRIAARRHRRRDRCTPMEPPHGNRRQPGNLTPTRPQTITVR